MFCYSSKSSLVLAWKCIHRHHIHAYERTYMQYAANINCRLYWIDIKTRVLSCEYFNGLWILHPINAWTSWKIYSYVVIKCFRNIRPLQWDYLLLITRSLVQTRGRAVIIIIHYCVFSGSSASSNSPSLGSSIMYGKIRVWLSFPSENQRSTTASTPSQHPHEQLLRSDTPFYITGIL